MKIKELANEKHIAELEAKIQQIPVKNAVDQQSMNRSN